MTEPTTGYHGLPPPTTAYREPTEHLPLVELGILEFSNLARPEVGIFGETAIMLEFLCNGFHYYDPKKVWPKKSLQRIKTALAANDR